MTQATAANTVCVVTPTKNIVASCLDELRKEWKALLDNGCRELTIDLKNVEIIDSRGLGLFMLCHNSISQVGGHVKVVTSNADLQHLFRIMKLDQHITVTNQL